MNLKLLTLLFLPLTNATTVQHPNSDYSNDPSDDLDNRSLVENPTNHYCGLTWPDAFDRCPLPCPSQQAEECASLGSGYDCFGYTGCNERVGGGGGGNESGGGVALNEGGNGGGGGGSSSESDVVANNKYCGATW